MNKKMKAIKKITDAAAIYDDKLINKMYLIIGCSDTFKQYSYYEIKFEASNFMHLTGVDTELKPGNFYRKCIGNKLSERDFELKENGTTMLKLNLLPDMFNIDKYRQIGCFKEDSYVKLKADIVSGNKTGVLALKEIHNNNYIPCSLISDNVKDCMTKFGAHNITHIYIKNKKDKLYGKLIYSDNQDHDLPKDITNLINL